MSIMGRACRFRDAPCDDVVGGTVSSITRSAALLPIKQAAASTGQPLIHPPTLTTMGTVCVAFAKTTEHVAARGA